MKTNKEDYYTRHDGDGTDLVATICFTLIIIIIAIAKCVG